VHCELDNSSLSLHGLSPWQRTDALRYVSPAYSLLCQLYFFPAPPPGRTFRFHLVRLGFKACKMLPHPRRSYLSRDPLLCSLGMGHRWYCHMADTGQASKPRSETAIVRPHKSTADPARALLPNYLIDITRIVALVSTHDFSHDSTRVRGESRSTLTNAMFIEHASRGL
jgi:hypothetical protein